MRKSLMGAWTAASVVVLGMTAAGCGDDGSDGSQASDADASASSDQTQASDSDADGDARSDVVGDESDTGDETETTDRSNDSDAPTTDSDASVTGDDTTDGDLTDGDPTDGNTTDDDTAVPDAGSSSTADASHPETPRWDEPNRSLMRPGTRLAVNTFVSEGGGQQFRHFVDTATGKPCRFHALSEPEGEFRCLDAMMLLPYFSDAGCQTPVVASGAELEQGALVEFLLTAPGGCSRYSEFSSVGEPVELTEVYTVSYTTGECEARDVPSGPHYSARPADLTSAVRGELRRDVLDPDTGIAIVYLDGEDGSSRVYDVERFGETCYAGPGDEAHDYCFPLMDAPDGAHSSAADCTTLDLVRVDETSCDEAPREFFAVHERDDFGCEIGRSVHTPGEATTELYLDNLDSCDLVEAEEATSYYTLGAEVPLSEFPEMSVTPLGAGRLVSRYESFGADRLGRLWDWFDTELGIPCSPQEQPDGVVRCLTSYWFVNSYAEYADAGCSEPVWSRFVYSCSQPPGQIIIQPGPDILLLGPYDGPVYRLEGDGCIDVEPQPYSSYYAADRVMSVEEFAPVSIELLE